jgi:predicted LPLAT superfamily acyltransferase
MRFRPSGNYKICFRFQSKQMQETPTVSSNRTHSQRRDNSVSLKLLIIETCTVLSRYYDVAYYDISSYYDAWQISRPQGIALALQQLLHKCGYVERVL